MILNSGLRVSKKNASKQKHEYRWRVSISHTSPHSPPNIVAVVTHIRRQSFLIGHGIDCVTAGTDCPWPKEHMYLGLFLTTNRGISSTKRDIWNPD